MQCLNCRRDFDVADDDPLWSITTAVGDDGVERITGRFIEPLCPYCGQCARWMPQAVVDATPPDAPGVVVTDIVDELNNVLVVNRLEEPLDLAYDPSMSATENLEAAAP